MEEQPFVVDTLVSCGIVSLEIKGAENMEDKLLNLSIEEAENLATVLAFVVTRQALLVGGHIGPKDCLTPDSLCETLDNIGWEGF